MKQAEREYTYKHPWDLVSSAHWQKYPNQLCPQVVDVQVAHRSVDPSTGKLYSTRLITTTSPVPSWASKLVGGNYAEMREESEVDPVNKRLVLRTTNISMSDVAEVQEVCTYEPHPENPEWYAKRTHFRQEFIVRAFPRGVSGLLEKSMISLACGNASRGRVALEAVCDRLVHEAQCFRDRVYSEAASLREGLPEALGATGEAQSV